MGTSKIDDGLLLYRQAALLGRFGGTDLSHNTMAASIVRVGAASQPVINLMRDHLPDSHLDIATGFKQCGLAFVRPVGVTRDKERFLLVADDVGNTIWRIGCAVRRSCHAGTGGTHPPCSYKPSAY